MADVLIIWLGFSSFSIVMGWFVSNYERRDQRRRELTNEALNRSLEEPGEDD